MINRLCQNQTIQTFDIITIFVVKLRVCGENCELYPKINVKMVSLAFYVM